MAKDQQDRELWEQQPGESGTLFAHFVFYRDMRYPKVTRQVKDEDGKIKKTTTETVMDGTVPYEKRSLRKTAEALGMNKRTIANQSAKWDWVRRCEAYDAHVDRMNREANEAAIRKMKQEHALLAQQMIRKATRRLLTMPDDEISAAELARIVDVGVKVERLSRGESTENQAVTHTGEVEVKRDAPLDLSVLSNEELDQFERLLEKIGGTSGG
ncbi:hypothetical protein [uncultured Oscillibacter sp.]|jgi:hypothetical protein|uniref:hypothetical protein n=1 Tax=uncultured Oscillibacter sp. TaxID=876091 RepID=UPI00266EDA8D|nr:hypothetical protein [uncultured Oscillibacter sp.]